MRRSLRFVLRFTRGIVLLLLRTSFERLEARWPLHSLTASDLSGALTLLQGPIRFSGPLPFWDGSIGKTLSNVSVYALRVGKHPCDLRGVRLRDENDPTELLLGLGRLRGEDVAHLGLAALELAGAGLLEALGRAAVCLQLWH